RQMSRDEFIYRALVDLMAMHHSVWSLTRLNGEYEIYKKMYNDKRRNGFMDYVLDNYLYPDVQHKSDLGAQYWQLVVTVLADFWTAVQRRDRPLSELIRQVKQNPV